MRSKNDVTVADDVRKCVCVLCMRERLVAVIIFRGGGGGVGGWGRASL